MNKYKISINDKNYIIYAESHEDAVKKLKDANIANTETILQKGTELIKNIKEDKNVKVEFETSYSTSNIYNKNNPKKAKLSISIMYEPDEESGWYIIEAYIKFENNKAMKLGLRQSDTKQGAIQALREIITKARKSIKDSGISDYQPKEISYKRIEDLPLKSRQELQNSKNKEATLLSIEGNIEDIINAANPEIKGDLQRIGSKILNDLRKQFKITDNKIKDDNNSEYKKELAKWQDLYINKKLITSSELSEKAKELRQKYNIKDEKLTSKQMIEKAKSLGGQAKQNGATGVLGISIASPQRSDEFADWLEKNNIHYNSDGKQYYVEIQDCEIGDKLIQSGSEEAFKKNIATEIRAGKDPKQAAAIAYNIQRENDSKVKDDIDIQQHFTDANKFEEFLNSYKKFGVTYKEVPNPHGNATMYEVYYNGKTATRHRITQVAEYFGKNVKVTPNSKLLIYDSSSIKDAYYNIGGYSSENDRMLQQDISKAKLYGLKTYIEKVDGNYQLTVEGPKSKVLKIVKDYFAGDVSAIGDSTIKDKTSAVAELVHSEYAHLYEPAFRSAGLKTAIRGSWFYVIGDKIKIDKIAKEQGINKVEYLSDYGIKSYFPELITDSCIKDSSDYIINYRNSYTGERNKETIKANSAVEAIKKFADAVALRGWGTRNIDIISISPNDGYVRLYGSLQALLVSKEFRDCNSIKDSNELDKYVGKRIKSSNDFLTFVKIASNNNYKWSNNSDGTMNVVIPSGRYNIKFKYDKEPDKNGDRVQVDKITKISDAEPKNWIYIMYGSDNREYKVDNLTKAEAEHLLKNNKLLGYDGKIFETNLVKDAVTYGITPEFKWRKGNKKPERIAKNLDEARYVKNSLERADRISYVIFEIETNKIVY